MLLPRVEWQIVAASNSAATTLKTNLDAALAGRSIERVYQANARTATLVRGDYRFNTRADADAVFAVAKTNATARPNAIAVIHNCDHDAQGRSTEGGCVMIERVGSGSLS